MFLPRQPSLDQVRQFISIQQSLPFSYSQVGATQTKPPAGYRVDHYRIELGEGQQTFQRAVAELRAWRQFDLGWVSVVPGDQPIGVGITVAVQARVLNVWSLNATRIVYVIDEEKRFGFAYGTLPDHVEEGEERFLVEQLEDGAVWYDIYAFSRPRHPLARLGFPVTRMLQKRFARESLAAMKSGSQESESRIQK